MQTSTTAWINVVKVLYHVPFGQSHKLYCMYTINNCLLKYLWLRMAVCTSLVYQHIIGAIDCTHVRIKVPPAHLHPDEYINRKKFHSINVQVVCDSDCVITDLVPA